MIKFDIVAVGAGAALAGMGQFSAICFSIDALKRERLWPYPYLDALVMGGILVARTEAQLLLIKRAGTPNTGAAATSAERKFTP